MNEINAIIIDGKVYEATESKESSCLTCDLIDDTGGCPCRDFCFEQGRCNVFRYSQSLTDKLNSNGIQQEDTSAGL